MIKVEQTELANYAIDPPLRGNCLAACVASIFEVPLTSFTDVYDSQSLWRWLGKYVPGIGMIAHTYYNLQGGINEVELGARRPEGYTGLPGATPWIAVVRSPRTDHMHCVVMINDKLAWDPHPERDMGIGKQTGDYAFTLDRPEKLLSGSVLGYRIGGRVYSPDDVTLIVKG